MNEILTLGSLFDGSGTFPVAGMLAGIKPVWASEIEPFPIRVTTKRLPWMKHYGDVSKINGAEIEPVDIITFGSPCTDLSVAGKRAGLNAERSGLFFQAVRIIKEMRCATNGKYPRFALWENVPGAFSSNKGEDFRCVIEELCKAKDPALSVPRPEKWEKAGEIMGEGFSLAWRTLSAEFWGVPQRRMRIYLVVDFDGERAGKILFESEGLSRYSAASFAAWQRAARSVEDRLGATGCLRVDGYNGSVGNFAATLGVNCGMSTGRNGVMVLNDQGGNRMDVTDDMTCTLRAEAHHPPCVLESAGFCTEHSAKARSIGYEEETSPTLRAGVVPAAIAVENHPTDSRVKLSDDGMVQTLTSRCGTGGNNVPLVLDVPITLKIRSGCEGGGKGPLWRENQSATLSCNNDQTVFVPFVKGTRPHSADECETWVQCETANTLNTFDESETRRTELIVQAFGICSKDSNAMKSDNPHSGFYEADTSRTIDANGGNPSCNQGGIVVIEGNGSRPSHQGNGYSESETMYTLNATEQLS